MKYLKISSLLVLSLLLFVPAALADVECELRPNSQRIRMESENEECWAPSPSGARRCTAVSQRRYVNAGDSTFDLEVEFNGMLSNDEDMPPTLWLVDVPTGGADLDDVSRPADADNPSTVRGRCRARLPAPMGEVSGDTVYWEDIRVSRYLATGTNSETFTIAMVYIDATSVGDDRLERRYKWTATRTWPTGQVLTVGPRRSFRCPCRSGAESGVRSGRQGDVQCLRAG